MQLKFVNFNVPFFTRFFIKTPTFEKPSEILLVYFFYMENQIFFYVSEE